MSTNSFVAEMDARTLGENGAPAVAAKGVGDNLVALFFKLVRDLEATALGEMMAAVDKSAAADLIVMAFQTRATRGAGKGEKNLFYQMLRRLDEHAVLAVLSLVPHYGYWKDLLLLQEVEGMPKSVCAKALDLMADQLKTDELELDGAEKEGRTPKLSLCAKYSPREGTYFDAKSGLGLAAKLAKLLFGGANAAASKRKYRKLVSKLNTALGTTEVLMAANRYSEIEMARVSSLCMQRCRKAFLNEALKGKLTPQEEETGNRHPADEGRVAARRHLREALAKKAVNGKQLMPHEIAAKCMVGRNSNLSTLEGDLMHAQWVSMREGVQAAMAEAAAAREAAVVEAAGEGASLESVATLRAALPKAIDLGNMVALVDVSGSMGGQPMEAAIGLGIVVSECANPAFRDRVLTFESRPQWVDLTGCAKIADKVLTVQQAGWGGSTNFEAACEQILSAAERAKLKPDAIPDLIVFSDMQFGMANCSRSSWETHHERLVRRFAEVGKRVCGEPYAAPRIVYWNLRGNTVGFPIQADAPNTQMISGFSPSLLKLVLSGKDLVADEKVVVMADGTKKVVREGPTPAETVRQALDDAAFDPVRLALAGVKEGPLAGYTFEKDGFEVVAAGGEAA